MEPQVNNQDGETISTADLIEQLEAAREAGDEARVNELEAILNGNEVQPEDEQTESGSAGSDAEVAEASA